MAFAGSGTFVRQKYTTHSASIRDLSMTIVCPKCNYVRKQTDEAPDWQCPACQVVYAKAQPHARTLSVRQQKQKTLHSSEGSSFFKWLLLIVLIVWGSYIGLHTKVNAGGDDEGASHLRSVSSKQLYSTENLQALAETVQAEDIVIYTTTHCPYCAQAKSWLKKQGFAYTECNADTDSHCAGDMQSFGADGTPYLVVRGHHMKNGFDTDEFLAVLGESQ
jgi:glutaredoxin/rubredoxin